MQKIHTLFGTIILTGLLLNACSSPAPVQPAVMTDPTAAQESMMEKASPTPAAMVEKASATPAAMPEKASATPETIMEKASPTPEAMPQMPVWYGVPLTNVTNAQTFKISDFKGKVVLVETMARWCSNCKKQQDAVKALHEKLGMSDDFVIIAMDIDPNENASDLKKYAAGNAFDWIYVVSPPEVSREIANLYGDQFLNPPSTPILIIDRQGTAHPLPFGIKSTDNLFKIVDEFLKAGL